MDTTQHVELEIGPRSTPSNSRWIADEPRASAATRPTVPSFASAPSASRCCREAEALVRTGCHAEAREAFETALAVLERDGASAAEIAAVNTSLAWASLELGDATSAAIYAGEALACPADAASTDVPRARALAALVEVAYARGDRAEARARQLELVRATEGSVTEGPRALVELAFADVTGGDLDSSAARLRRARRLTDGGDDRETGAFARAVLALEEVLRGNEATAERYLEEARPFAEGSPTMRAVLNGVDAVVGAVRCEGLAVRGDAAAAANLWPEVERAAVRLAGDRRAAGSIRTRRLLTTLEELVRARDPMRTWVVGPRAGWVRTPGGQRVDLAKRPLLRVLFTRLLDQRTADPSRSVLLRDLALAGWPSEEPSSPTVKNRLKVALSTMRKLGLRGAIAASADGVTAYHLAPDQRFVSLGHNGASEPAR